jgi:hypothetical protein
MEPIQEYVNRPKRYFNIDGLGELSVGLIMLAFPVCDWLGMTTPKGSVRALVLGLLPFVLWLFLIPRGAEAIRKRITYARTGYAQRPDRVYLKTLVLFALVAVLLLPLWGMMPPLRRLNPTEVMGICGILLTAAYAYEFARAVRWKWIVVLVLACGTAAACILGWGFYKWGWLGRLFAFVGITWIVSGSITFYQYLRHTQPAARTAE